MSKHPSYAVSVLGAVLTSPATLAKLAARGMFASVPLSMPPDIHSANIKTLFEGEVTEQSIIEVYAPGDETGWAVVYKPRGDGMHTGETELIWGQWELKRGARSTPTEVVKVEMVEEDTAEDVGVLDLADEDEPLTDETEIELPLGERAGRAAMALEPPLFDDLAYSVRPA